MSDVKEAIETPKEKTPQQVRAELAGLLFQKSTGMAAEYKQLIRHTGGLMSQSMVVAYTRGINDVIKLILKQNEGDKNEKPVQEKGA